MEIICGACGKKHKSNTKLEESLNKLEPGKKIRLKCSQCQEAILLDKDTLLKHQAAQKLATAKVKPPEPPDTAWLYEGEFVDDEMVADIPQAMVLMPEGKAMDEVLRALAGLGYQAITVEHTRQALEKMQFVNYANIVLHTQFEGGGLSNNQFHNYMCRMNMARRRFIFYVLIGPELNTFYNLESLANSANLVVAEEDTPKFDIILRKAIPEYEELFGAYMTELRVQGR